MVSFTSAYFLGIFLTGLSVCIFSIYPNTYPRFLWKKPQRDESLFFSLNGGFCRREKGSMREEQVKKC